MTLLGLLFSGRKAAFVAVVVFSVLSALLSVAVLAFIGQRMLSAQADLGLVLLQFSGLLAALLAAATIASAAARTRSTQAKGASDCGPAQRAMPGSERSRQAGSARMKSAAGPRMCWWWPMAASAPIPTAGGRS